MKKKVSFSEAHFVTSAVKASQFPSFQDGKGEPWPEIAAAGRSNVGKSTLINHLMRRRKLAKTSQTPGKTQLINFFSVDDQLLFTDLPGYGFAQVPEPVRRQWGKMIEGYVEQRKSLKVILFLLDIRRLPNQDDLQLLEWLEYHNKSVILVLTKADKIPKTKRKAQIMKILKAFDGNHLPYVPYSSTGNIGRDQLIELINQVLLSNEASE